MKRVRIAIVIVVVALAGVIGWQVVKPSEPEPVYKGRTLRSWLEDYSLHLTDFKNHNPEPEQAVRQIGTNAIPTLLHWLRKRDSTFEVWLRRNDSALKVKVVDLLARTHVVKATPASHWNLLAVLGFQVLRTDAQAAVPELIEIAKLNISDDSKWYAIGSLSSIGPAARQAVPYLLQLANSDAAPRTDLISAILEIEPRAGVPYLLRWATNSDPNLRRVGRQSLLGIDPEAAARAGITNEP